MENRILLLEDDVSLIDGLQYSLKKNGFDVDFVRSVQETLTYLSEIEKYDMLILDVTLPDGTGFEICEKVRKNGSQIPIIFLTASDEEVSIIRGLDCGGDDYITKPFKLGELCSRIRALLRRAGLSTQGTGAVMECGDIRTYRRRIPFNMPVGKECKPYYYKRYYFRRVMGQHRRLCRQ